MEISTQPRPVGRPCGVCALPASQRTAVETSLASGEAFSRIARAHPTISRDGLRRHVNHGHLPEALQDAVTRLYGLDATTIAARVLDIAQRARVVAHEAFEAGHHSTVLRAGDAETRALAVLAGMNVAHESAAQDAEIYRTVARAAWRAAKLDETYADEVALQLDRAGADDLAAEIRQIHESSKELTS